MAQRQKRDPGQLLSTRSAARVGQGAPGFAVDESSAWQALAKTGDHLAGLFGGMADRAAARTGAEDGRHAGLVSGDHYQQKRLTEIAAVSRNSGKGAKFDRDRLHRAQLMQESGGDASAVSSAGAMGLMQIMADTARQPGFGMQPLANPMDAKTNEVFGRLYMDNMLARFDDDVPRALAGYNWGVGNADKWDGRMESLPAETRNYIKTIMANSAGKSEPKQLRVEYPQGIANDLPLALRRDGTIYGQAFDQAATQAYSWRMASRLKSELGAAYETHKDDPAAFKEQLSQIHGEFLKDDTFGDPQMREVFEQQFTSSSEAYQKSVLTRQEAGLRREEQASIFEGLETNEAELERQAYALGGSADGDVVMAREMAKASVSIDEAMGRRIITPLQANGRRDALASRVMGARIHGMYDALDGVAAKRAFADQILIDWAAKRGPLKNMPFASVETLAGTLQRDAVKLTAEEHSQRKLAHANARQLLDDDLASTLKTGEGVNLEEAGSSVDEMVDLLGADRIEEWRAKKRQASLIYEATAGISGETPEEITGRLAALTPKPGMPGYETALRVFDAATKKANAVLKLRSRDPVQAVTETYSELSQRQNETDFADPEALQVLMDERIKAQEAVGISGLAQNVLSLAEARAVAQPLRFQTLVEDGEGNNPGQNALADLWLDVQDKYGDHAQTVMRQVLHVGGLDRNLSAVAAYWMKKTAAGEKITAVEQRRGLHETELSQAQNGLSGKAKVKWPNTGQVKHLLANPQLSQEFDSKFGEGSADNYIKSQRDGGIDKSGKIIVKGDRDE